MERIQRSTDQKINRRPRPADASPWSIYKTLKLGFQNSYRLKFKVRSYAGTGSDRKYSKWGIFWLEEEDIKNIVS